MEPDTTDPGPIETGPERDSPSPARRAWARINSAITWVADLFRRRHHHYYRISTAAYFGPGAGGLMSGATGHTVVYMACYCHTPEQITSVTLPGKITTAQLLAAKAKADNPLSMYAAGMTAAEAVQVVDIIRAALAELAPTWGIDRLDSASTALADMLWAAGVLAADNPERTSTPGAAVDLGAARP